MSRGLQLAQDFFDPGAAPDVVVIVRGAQGQGSCTVVNGFGGAAVLRSVVGTAMVAGGTGLLLPVLTGYDAGDPRSRKRRVPLAPSRATRSR